MHNIHNNIINVEVWIQLIIMIAKQRIPKELLNTHNYSGLPQHMLKLKKEHSCNIAVQHEHQNR